MERAGIITMNGKALTLLGDEAKVGDKARDFKLLDMNMEQKTLADYAGKIKVISVTPSLDTPVCDLQIHRFNEEAASQPGSVALLNISADLPFAIKRFCAAGGVNSAVALSDHKDVSFGLAYGILIKELRLLARSVFIIGVDDVVHYADIVTEQTNEPNYDEAIRALKTLI
ncbi:MAG: thiol peroxidase [Synergistaceae bacterium]|jgi:thiol peroxidase|nr:thiol peroxidase [Synergistaceae bacterium]